MSEDVKKDIIDTQKAKEFATSNGKNDAKSLEQFVVSILQTNKTIFCIALAFSIFLYFQPVRMPFSHYFTQDGFSMTFEYFSKKVNGYSTFLFITEIFLTAFAITRFLQMINIVDIIMRMPLVCDLIFWLRYEDRIKMKWIKSNLEWNFYLNKLFYHYTPHRIGLEIFAHEFYDWIQERYDGEMEDMHVELDYKYSDLERDLQKYKLAKITYQKNSYPIINISYLLLRQITIHKCGYFYEKEPKKLALILLAINILFSFFFLCL